MCLTACLLSCAKSDDPQAFLQRFEKTIALYCEVREKVGKGDAEAAEKYKKLDKELNDMAEEGDKIAEYLPLREKRNFEKEKGRIAEKYFGGK